MAKKPPEDDWGGWKESYDDEKTFEGMVAERLVIFGWRNPVKTYAKLKSAPWLKSGLSGVGDFQTIMKLYSKKRKIKLSIDKKRIKSFMALFKDEIAAFSKDKIKKNC